MPKIEITFSNDSGSALSGPATSRQALPTSSGAAAGGAAKASHPPAGRRPGVVRLPRNVRGRDFVVGDIHGGYEAVVQALKAVQFKPDRDRLLCCGDLVDRGPESRRALAFLAMPYVHAVCGNHEDMFLDLHKKGDPHPGALEFVCSRNGMGWWKDLSAGERTAFLSRFEKLPIAIEVDTPRGTVGIVHAEVPSGMDWPSFVAALEGGDERVKQTALWGRDRIGRSDADGVVGIGRVFHGHTPVDAPRRLGNVYHIDTGSVFGLLSEDPVRGRLTVAGIACHTGLFDATVPPANALVDARVDSGHATGPFGAYAKSKPVGTER